MNKVVFIGAGNLATNLAKELYLHSFDILQIYSRTLESASLLAKQVDSEPIDCILNINPDADLYIFSVKDSVINDLICQIPSNNALWVHTAGSLPLDIFNNKVNRFGVIYPFQTFSKDRLVDFKEIPFFIEANNELDENLLLKFCQKISTKVYKLTYSKRQFVHLTGVFACNFVNDMYTISSIILEKENIPYDIILPLVDETTAKIHQIKPIRAQTGPAIRFDENIMNKHLALLEDDDLKSIYKLISNHIHKINTN